MRRNTAGTVKMERVAALIGVDLTIMRDDDGPVRYVMTTSEDDGYYPIGQTLKQVEVAIADIYQQKPDCENPQPYLVEECEVCTSEMSVDAPDTLNCVECHLSADPALYMIQVLEIKDGKYCQRWANSRVGSYVNAIRTYERFVKKETTVAAILTKMEQLFTDTDMLVQTVVRHGDRSSYIYPRSCGIEGKTESITLDNWTEDVDRYGRHPLSSTPSNVRLSPRDEEIHAQIILKHKLTTKDIRPARWLNQPTAEKELLKCMDKVFVITHKEDHAKKERMHE